eukprot:8653568-Pyramimonas_sp.AAC.1
MQRQDLRVRRHRSVRPGTAVLPLRPRAPLHHSILDRSSTSTLDRSSTSTLASSSTLDPRPRPSIVPRPRPRPR